MSNLVNRDFPLRFGVVPQIDSADGTSLLRDAVSLNTRLINILRNKDGETLLLSLQKLWAKEDTIIPSSSMCDSNQTSHTFLSTEIYLVCSIASTTLSTNTYC
jgi:hypothetical protein